jgi:hypothetical protein
MNMHKVLKALSSRLDRETKIDLVSRVDNMMRGLRYEADQRSKEFRGARENGWTLEKMEIVCCLNAFYQIVLGPISAATRGATSVGLVRDIPVQYGTKVRVTQEEAVRLKKCHDQFMRTVRGLGIDRWCLQSPHSHDLLYRLATSPSHGE